MKKIYLLPIILFVFLACEKENASSEEEDKELSSWENHQSFTTSYPTFSMPFSEDFIANPEAIGEVNLSETSGLAYSVNNPGMIWAHNDSGHPNIIFLLDAENGNLVARYTINGSNSIDWEDMEIAIDPQNGEAYLYIGDIGDNSERRPNYSIYRFKEPVYQESHSAGGAVSWDPEDFSRIRINYPDGSHDAESLFLDPETQDIFLVTKRDVNSTIYVVPFPYDASEENLMYKVGEFSFRNASAGTVSLDGSKVLIKNRQEIFYWTRQEGETMAELLQRTPVKAPYVGEPQGEAVCFDHQHNYYTLSEELNNSIAPTLYKYTYKTN
ncbi:hypothetical protein [Salegentibacter sp. Hel_I_6]|uniref:hypothetical protein n=1 Tax=Salegentibacter sp. Hel_I_6 TaxID=1250278 RepID=UPI0006905BED|nr:hypothetical protein [Salegentibacter sp. Hel_I_6]